MAWAAAESRRQVSFRRDAVRARPLTSRLLPRARRPRGLPRPDKTVYVTGYPDPPAFVTERPGAVEVRPDAVRRLTDAMRKVSTELANAPVLREQACHLPFSRDGNPVLGRAPDVDGAYVATGAGCWGILCAPATGLAMAELILDGEATSVDLSPFDPARFAGGGSFEAGAWLDR